MEHGLVAVTGSEKPYLFDLPRILCLPEGFEMRFRYRLRWVDPDLVEQLRTNQDALNGKPIVLLFHSQGTKRLLPIRSAEVVSCELLGGVIFVRFRLKAFFAGYNPASRAAYASGLAAARLGLDAATDLGAALPAGGYLRRLTAAIDDQEEQARKSVNDTTRWSEVVEVLAGEKDLHNLPLFHFIGFEPLTSSTPLKPGWLFPDAWRQVGGGQRLWGFSMTEGVRYRMRVLQACHPGASQPVPLMRVRCDTPGKAVLLEGASDYVVGKYDVLEYTVLATSSGYSELGIVVEVAGPPAPGAPTVDGRGLLRARIPVVVTTNWKRAWVRWLGLLGGIVLYILGVLPKLIDSTSGPVALAVGAALQFVGLFLTVSLGNGFLEQVAKKRLLSAKIP